MAINGPMSDKEWRAQSDAHTLAEAEEIKRDNLRLNNAKRMAKRMAKEKKEEADRLNNISGRQNVLNSDNIQDRIILPTNGIRVNETGSMGRSVRKR